MVLFQTPVKMVLLLLFHIDFRFSNFNSLFLMSARLILLLKQTFGLWNQKLIDIVYNPLMFWYFPIVKKSFDVVGFSDFYMHSVIIKRHIHFFLLWNFYKQFIKINNSTEILLEQNYCVTSQDNNTLSDFIPLQNQFKTVKKNLITGHLHSANRIVYAKLVATLK